MGKHDFNSPKDIANRMKAKGLQRLRWYCQMCEKQCRDENGFKCHCASESHQRQMAIFAETPEKFMQSFSKEFQDEYVRTLSRRYGTTRVLANQVYQEIVANRQHLHMNSTQWDTLTDFVKHLGRTGVCVVDETEKGWFVQWIDNSPAALARREAIQKKDRQSMDDEQREKKLLQEQIERAQAASKDQSESESKESQKFSELKRSKDGETIKLKMTSKTTKPGLSNVFKKTTNPLKSTATTATKDSTDKPKKSNPFASLKQNNSKNGTSKDKEQTRNKPLSAAEEIIIREQRRKQYNQSSDNYQQQQQQRGNTRRSRSRSPNRRLDRGGHYRKRYNSSRSRSPRRKYH